MSDGDKKVYPQFRTDSTPGLLYSENTFAVPAMTLSGIIYTQLVGDNGGGAPIVLLSFDNGPTQLFVDQGLLGVVNFNYSYNFDGDSWFADENFSTATDALDIADLGSGRLPAHMQFQYGFNGATYDRLRSFAANADALAAPTLGLLGVRNFLALFNGTTFDRARSFGADADALAAPTLGLIGARDFPALFNGTTYDRLRSASATNISATTQIPALTSQPGTWAVNSNPGVNTVATVTRAAGAAGVRHVCRSVSIKLVAVATATEAVAIVNLRDGTSGTGTVLQSWTLLASASSHDEVNLTDLYIVGSAATAMTLEFTAASGALTFQSVNITGHDVI